MIWIELAVVLTSIVVGIRLKGVGLGVMGALGLLLLVFGFHLQPVNPPFNVLMVIMAAVTAASAMEAAGGLSYLTYLASSLIQRHPTYITFISPVVSYLFTFLSGTSHLTYSILPIVAEVARKTGVRPERPLTATVIASQQAILGSPISVAAATAFGILEPFGLSLPDLMKICIPSTVIGLIMGTLVSSRLGSSTYEAPNTPESEESNTTLELAAPRKAKLSVMLFLSSVVIIVFLGTFKQFLPHWKIGGEIKMMKMTDLVAMVMLTVAALIVLVCRPKTKEIVRGRVFVAGMQAVIVILGITWLGGTFFKGNLPQITALIKARILESPWQFSFLLFFTTLISTSQAATLQLLLPLGLSLGLPMATLLGALPAVNSFFFIPSYPTMVAAVELDQSGTTRVGKFIINHSFMLPGIAATGSACIASFLLAKWLF